MRLPLFIRRLFDRTGVQTSIWMPPQPLKPRVRIRKDGWIMHPPGHSFPFFPTTIVEIRFQGGLTQTGRDADYARVWHDNCWKGLALSWKYNIVAYRIVALRQPMIPSECPARPDPRHPIDGFPPDQGGLT